MCVLKNRVRIRTRLVLVNACVTGRLSAWAVVSDGRVATQRQALVGVRIAVRAAHCWAGSTGSTGSTTSMRWCMLMLQYSRLTE